LSAIFCFSAVTHSHHFDFACDVFKLSAINHSVGSVSKIKIITENTAMSDDDYKSMMKFLSKELHVRVEAYNDEAQGIPWLFISRGAPQVTERLSAINLAENQHYNDKTLQSWETLTKEQTNKLTTESQKTKPDLANHDHQILFQTEADDNIHHPFLCLFLPLKCHQAVDFLVFLVLPQ
jgi:hypothetical protein